MLTNNSYSVTYNFASASGNKDLAEGLMKYDGTRGTTCGSSLQASAKAKAYATTCPTAALCPLLMICMRMLCCGMLCWRSDDENLISTSVSSQTVNRENLNLIQLCVNFTVFGSNSSFFGVTQRELPQYQIAFSVDTSASPPGYCTRTRIQQYESMPSPPSRWSHVGPRAGVTVGACAV